jgi:hypothetical protein
MHEYEIRLLRADSSTATIIETTYFNDDAAISFAQKIAGARPFEVWRDLDCLHGRGQSFPNVLKLAKATVEDRLI